MQLKDRIAVVTGAGRGIGAAIAKTFAREGATVVCVSRTEKNSQAIADEIIAAGGQALPVAADVSDPAAAAATMDATLAKFGGVDILVNNAGVTRDTLLMRMSEEDWDVVMQTNLKGAFLWTRAATKIMVKRRWGRVINISSVAGLMGNAGQANYAASKAGLVGFTKSVARELASRNITANAIAPGFILSDMTSVLPDAIKEKVVAAIPMSRFGEPTDIAAAALFLAGESGRYITGQVITVDGGMVM
jgi:3-oxoacyl-[acyl-carrier protein] reductase